jgi:hypothetical protein
MPLLIRCPDCEADNRVAEDKKGETISCKLCGVPFKVGKDAKFVELNDEEKKKAEEKDGPKSKRKSRRTDLDDEDDDDKPRKKRRDDDDDDDRPRPRARPRGHTTSGMSAGQKTAAGVGGGLVVAAIAGVAIWAATSNKNSTGGSNSPSNNNTNTQQAKDAQVKKDGGVPGKKESDFDATLRGLKENPQRHHAGWFAGQRVDPARQVEVARALENALKNSDVWVGYDALESLKRWGDKDSVKPVVNFLETNNGPPRDRAIDTLGALKYPESAQAMVALMKTEPGTRGKFAAALNRFPPSPATAKEVATLLDEADNNVRVEAAKILGNVGTKDVLPVLEEKLTAARAAKDGPSRNLATQLNAAINKIKARGA